MKRIVLLILVLTAVYGLANCQSLMYGQQKSSSMPRVGLCGGLNVCAVTGTDDEDFYYGSDGSFYPTVGINGGFMLYFPVMSDIILQGELILNTKGAIYSYTADLMDQWGNYLGEAEFDVSHIYGYAEIPMLAKLNLDFMGAGVQPYVGGSVGYLLFAEEGWSVSGDQVEDDSDSASIKEYLNDVEVSAIVGCDVLLGKSLMLGLRYSQGITEVFAEDHILWGGARNQCLTVNAGIMFNLF